MVIESTTAQVIFLDDLVDQLAQAAFNRGTHLLKCTSLLKIADLAQAATLRVLSLIACVIMLAVLVLEALLGGKSAQVE